MPLADVNANIEYNHITPFYVWVAFMLYNWFHTNIGFYSLLHAFVSMDYRVLLITMNLIGLYLFLKNVRIDFTMRVRMNTED